MRAIELRIGNIVSHNGKEIAIAPKALMEYYYIGDTHVNSSLDKREYKPIPITEEWLMKFGFEKQSEWWFKDHKLSIEKWSTKEGIDVRLRTSEDSSVFITDIQYVHQLQNLYFALIGEELTLKK